MSLADTIPILGPLLADAQFRWWLLGMYLAIGPVPEDIPAKDPNGVPVTKWRWGGLLRVFLLAAISHSRLAERVGSLEHVMANVVVELRALRTGIGQHFPAVGEVAVVDGGEPIASVSTVARVADVRGEIRRPAPSRP